MTIGNDVEIGFDSAIIKDVTNYMVAAGKTCRFIRESTEVEQEYQERQLSDYRIDML